MQRVRRQRGRVPDARGGAAGLVAALVVAAAPGAGSPAGASAGLVLHEVHTGLASPETVRVYLAPGRVRVSHPGGDAILRLDTDRLLLVDPATSTFRSTSLSGWEAGLEASLHAGGDPEPDRESPPAGAPLQFTHGGPGGRVAGYACDRYHLYLERELFPGEAEAVELEIWVTREIDLDGGAWEAYRRAQRSMDRVDLGGLVQRPPGLVLRMRLRARGASGQDEIEQTEVVRVEQRVLPDSVFAAPVGFVRMGGESGR